MSQLKEKWDRCDICNEVLGTDWATVLLPPHMKQESLTLYPQIEKALNYGDCRLELCLGCMSAIPITKKPG